MVGVVVEAVVVEAVAGVTARRSQTEAAVLQFFMACSNVYTMSDAELVSSRNHCTCRLSLQNTVLGSRGPNNSRSRRRNYQASSFNPIPAARAAASPSEEPRAPTLSPGLYATGATSGTVDYRLSLAIANQIQWSRWASRECA